MRLNCLAGMIVTGVLLSAAGSKAAELTITITNLTDGIYFKELLVAAHAAENTMFRAGYVATAGLEALAECGDQSTLAAELRKEIARLGSNPPGALEEATSEVAISEGPAAEVWGVSDYAGLQLLGPGEVLTIGPLTVSDSDNTFFAIAGRMMATNDGIAGLEAQDLLVTPGSYTLELLGFDAGTEPNTERLGDTGELCSTIDINSNLPDLPGTLVGRNGEGVAIYRIDGTVHIHRGVLGDNDSEAGSSDLDPTLHRWLNPVGRVELTVVGD